MPTDKSIRAALILAAGGEIAPGRWPGLTPRPVPLPGFDAPAVTLADLRLWMAVHVPHIDPDSHRGRTYAHDYDIAGKVARDEAVGRWPP